ncbi:MAG: hypothetical protein ACRYFA_12075 [Janthinobacterium lividum]
MKQQEILKKIGGIIAELKEQYTYLEAAGSSFNDLELELFMANANFLTDHIEILKKIYGQAKPAALPVAKEVLQLEKPEVQKPQIPDYFSEDEHLQYADETILISEKNIPVVAITEPEMPQKTVLEIVQHEAVLLPEIMPQAPTDDSTIVEDASFTEQKLEEAEKREEKIIKPEIEVVSEVFLQPEINIQPEPPLEPVVYIEEKKSEYLAQESVKSDNLPVLTLNQRMAAQKGLDQPKIKTTEVSQKPVQDLQSLINLNDKLLFVKELFNGYNLAYSEAINILNRYTTFEQAERFLDLNYSVKNNWKEKPATAERFYDLLRKKFA